MTEYIPSRRPSRISVVLAVAGMVAALWVAQILLLDGHVWAFLVVGTLGTAAVIGLFNLYLRRFRPRHAGRPVKSALVYLWCPAHERYNLYRTAELVPRCVCDDPTRIHVGRARAPRAPRNPR